jgi:hypothetical protein
MSKNENVQNSWAIEVEILDGKKYNGMGPIC